MSLFSTAERAQVKDAIATIETRTSGEVVAVVAHAADDYWDFSLAWAIVAALIVPAAALIFWPHAAALTVYELQMEMFIAVLALTRVRALRMLIVPRRTQAAYAQRLARAQFFTQGLHRTRERTGVLIFVSVAEHYVEILADEGIALKVPPADWEAIVAAFVANVRARRFADGLITAIRTCGDKLAQHFPHAAGDRNELSNRLVELP